MLILKNEGDGVTGKGLELKEIMCMKCLAKSLAYHWDSAKVSSPVSYVSDMVAYNCLLLHLQPGIFRFCNLLTGLLGKPPRFIDRFKWDPKSGAQDPQLLPLSVASQRTVSVFWSLKLPGIYISLLSSLKWHCGPLETFASASLALLNPYLERNVFA